MKLLIDECLSPELTTLAHENGHESSHVAHLGKGGVKDWDLFPFVIANDWTLVTRNSIDFRGPAGAKGSGGEYAKVEIHSGLICLNGHSMDRQLQIEMFAEALEEIRANGDLVNQALEITADGEHLMIERYNLPR